MGAIHPRSDLISSIRWLTEPMLYPESHGDNWACTWADDGELYTVACDTLGIGNACRSNLAIHRLTGTPPEHRAVTINPMSEYLGLGKPERLDMWKGNGILYVDGALYLSVSQHTAVDIGLDNVQRAHSASIVRSLDYGRTWSPKPTADQSMFPTHRFATPFFVQFGQAYAGAPAPYEDHIYAVATASWNNGNYMVLGRVRRERMGRLDPGDWEFFAGANERDEATWQSDILKAQPVFRLRGCTSETGIHYVPAIDRFILPQWAYIDLDNPLPWDHTMLHLYEAPRPWGPWRLFHSEPDWGVGYYNPCLPSKWFEEGGRRMWMVMAGNWTNAFHERQDIPFAYGLIVQKLEICL